MTVRQLANGRFQADWYDVLGTRHRPSFRRERDARRAEQAGVDQRAQGIAPTPRPVSLHRFVQDAWTPTVRSHVRAQTWIGYERNLRLHILPALGDHTVQSIDTATVQRFVNGLTKRGQNAPNVERIFATLRTVLSLAAAHRYCAPLDRRALRLPKRDEPFAPAIVPTISQLDQLGAVIDPRFRVAVALAGYMGLRQGEVFAVHPIDVEDGRLHVCRSLEQKTGRLVNRTKSARGEKRGDRYVTIPDHVAAAIREHQAEYPCERLVVHHAGKPVSASWFYKQVWVEARLAAGMPQLRFHDLRHCAPTIMAGVYGWGPKRVQIELGHSTSAFTLDRYGHLWPDEDGSGRQAMNDALRVALTTARSAAGEVRTPTPEWAPAFRAGASTSSATAAGTEDTDGQGAS